MKKILSYLLLVSIPITIALYVWANTTSMHSKNGYAVIDFLDRVERVLYLVCGVCGLLLLIMTGESYKTKRFKVMFVCGLLIIMNSVVHLDSTFYLASPVAVILIAVLYSILFVEKN